VWWRVNRDGGVETQVEDPDVGTRFVVWIGRHTPGAEAPFFNRVERPRLKPWGTQKQNAETTADPLSGMTTRETRAAAKAKAE
jgi:hypothetical protein